MAGAQASLLYHAVAATPRPSCRPQATPRRLNSAAARRQRAPLTRAEAAGSAAAATDASAQQQQQQQRQQWGTHSWLWRGHRVRYATAGCGPPVVLVHGFGASHRHWRSNIMTLADAGFKVYAIDLLGQGGSEKPRLDYEMELWRDQILDFMAEFVQQPAVIVGNSLGSLASLMVAAAAPERVAGVTLLNCAGGMNNKAIADDWRIKLAWPVFMLIDFLLQTPPVARFLFDKFRTRDNISSVLQSVYGNTEAVDEELVDLIYQPSCDEGALDAFVSIMTGPPGPRPDRLLTDTIAETMPLLVLWGDRDPFTPADGPIGRFFQALPQARPATQFTFLPGESAGWGVGHCPHDDAPELVHAELIPWCQSVLAAAPQRRS